MTRCWEPTTLKLTPKQARVLAHLLAHRVEGLARESRRWRCPGCSLPTLRAILCKLEGKADD